MSNPARDLADWTVISRYSRAEALADGTLIDITPTASSAGFRLPTVITATLLADYPTDLAQYNLLMRFHRLIRRGHGSESLLTLPDAQGSPILLHIGPGDTSEPVLTLMRPVDL